MSCIVMYSSHTCKGQITQHSLAVDIQVNVKKSVELFFYVLETFHIFSDMVMVDDVSHEENVWVAMPCS